VAIVLMIFGFLLPYLIAKYVARWVSGKLEKWWGKLLAMMLSLISGFLIPYAIYGMSSTIMGFFDARAMVQLMGSAMLVSLVTGVYFSLKRRAKENL